MPRQLPLASVWLSSASRVEGNFGSSSIAEVVSRKSCLRTETRGVSFFARLVERVRRRRSEDGSGSLFARDQRTPSSLDRTDESAECATSPGVAFLPSAQTSTRQTSDAPENLTSAGESLGLCVKSAFVEKQLPSTQQSGVDSKCETNVQSGGVQTEVYSESGGSAHWTSVRTPRDPPAPTVKSGHRMTSGAASLQFDGKKPRRSLGSQLAIWERQALLAASTLGGRSGPSCAVQTAEWSAAQDESVSAEEIRRVQKAIRLFCSQERRVQAASSIHFESENSSSSLQVIVKRLRMEASATETHADFARDRRLRGTRSVACFLQKPPSTNSLEELAKRLRKYGAAASEFGRKRNDLLEDFQIQRGEGASSVEACRVLKANMQSESSSRDAVQVLSSAMQALEVSVFGTRTESVSAVADTRSAIRAKANSEERPAPLPLDSNQERKSASLKPVDLRLSVEDAVSHLAWINWASRKEGIDLSSEIAALRRSLRRLQKNPSPASLLPRRLTTPCLAALREWKALHAATSSPASSASTELVKILFRAAEATSASTQNLGVAFPHLSVFASFLKEEAAVLRSELRTQQEDSEEQVSLLPDSATLDNSSESQSQPLECFSASRAPSSGSSVLEETEGETHFHASAEEVLDELGVLAEEERRRQLELLRCRQDQGDFLAERSSGEALENLSLFPAETRADALAIESQKRKMRQRSSARKAGEFAALLDSPLHAEELTIRNLSIHLSVPEVQLRNLASLLLEEKNSSADFGAISGDTLLTEEEAEFLSDELGCFEKLRLASRVGGRYRSPAVVAVLGHVDHGKTTLLDALRKTRVADSEVGGITQRVSGGSIDLPSVRLSCIDTPGHAAFFSMRERGALATDIILLVVSAEEGVKPQTLECIKIIKQRASGVKVVVAATKMDRPGASFERVKRELAAYGLVSDEDGGDVPFVAVSAKTGQGLDDLEAALALQQETLSHLWTQPAPSEKAAASGARAFVLEAKTDARRGRCLQVVVRSGWLKEGAWVCLGQHAVKLKRIWKAEDTEQGERWMSVKLAGPSEIVEISGFGNIVSDAASLVGQLVMQVKNPQQALKLATMARRAAEEESGGSTGVTGGRTLPEVPLVLKAVDQGSLEALVEWINNHNDSLRAKDPLPERIQQLHNKALPGVCKVSSAGQDVRATGAECGVSGNAALKNLLRTWKPLRIVRSGVGPISATDARQAQISDALIVAFGVSALDDVKEALRKADHPVREQDIIYRVFEDLEAISDFHFGPQFEFVQVGRSIITQIGSYSLKNSRTPETVVGLEVKEGFLSSQHVFTLVRDGVVVVEQLAIKSMQKNKETVGSLPKGSRDGAVIFDSMFVDFKKGDVMLSLEKKERLPPPFIKGLHFLRTD